MWPMRSATTPMTVTMGIGGLLAVADSGSRCIACTHGRAPRAEWRMIDAPPRTGAEQIGRLGLIVLYAFTTDDHCGPSRIASELVRWHRACLSTDPTHGSSSGAPWRELVQL